MSPHPDREKKELLPCPFCGGNAGVAYGEVFCTTQGCGLADAMSPEQWNTRPTAQEPVADHEMLIHPSRTFTRPPVAPVSERDWLPIESAPKDGTVIQVRCEDKNFAIEFLASWQVIPDSREDGDGWGWIAKNEDEHPQDWHDGICWESNADEVPSNSPTHWKPALSVQPTKKEG